MSNNSKTFAPSFTACRLFKKMSGNGVEYFAGRMGGVRITLFRSREPSVEGDEVWELKFAEAPPKQQRDTDERRDHQRPAAAPQARSAPARRPASIDDEIPF